MSDPGVFGGFPGVARATAVPNVFFASVLPRMRSVEALLAFLWVSRCVQEQKGGARFVSAGELRATPGVAESFTTMGGGCDRLEAGLLECVELGALLGLRLAGRRGEEAVFFVNNPGSRRAVARVRAGDLVLRPETAAVPITFEDRPSVFRLYEENIGTITPMVGERLLAAAEAYPAEWLEQAFREAAEMNIRNWRYVERILQRWSEEGRGG